MRRNAEVLVFQQPTDYVLYNKIVDLLESSASCLNGNYMPSLDKAEELLNSNPSGGCALSLLFLSDGKPSDEHGTLYDECGVRLRLQGQQRHLLQAKKKIARMSSKFGRRLSVHTIGFGALGEDFAVLKAMSAKAEEYGSKSTYSDASLDVQALSNAIDRYSSTLSSTMTECTEVSTGAARTVREVKRESQLSQFEHASVNRIDESWTVHIDSSSQSADVARTLSDYDALGLRVGGTVLMRQTFDVGLKDWCRTAQMSMGAVAVAMKEEIFGEGAERMVRALMSPCSSFIGQPPWCFILCLPFSHGGMSIGNLPDVGLRRCIGFAR